MGLMWFDPDSIQATVYDKQLRHEARQEDKLRRYGWLRHDGRRYGRQELVDGDYAYSIQMVGVHPIPTAGLSVQMVGVYTWSGCVDGVWHAARSCSEV
jgi:hypothetical protein